MAIRIKKIKVLPNYCLQILFEDGKEIVYDVKDDIATLPTYKQLESEQGLFESVQIDPSRTCIIWNKNIDLPSDILYEYGVPV